MIQLLLVWFVAGYVTWLFGTMYRIVFQKETYDNTSTLELLKSLGICMFLGAACPVVLAIIFVTEKYKVV